MGEKILTQGRENPLWRNPTPPQPRSAGAGDTAACNPPAAAKGDGGEHPESSERSPNPTALYLRVLGTNPPPGSQGRAAPRGGRAGD